MNSMSVKTIILFSLLGLYGCTQDYEAVEEPISPAYSYADGADESSGYAAKGYDDSEADYGDAEEEAAGSSMPELAYDGPLEREAPASEPDYGASDDYVDLPASPPPPSRRSRPQAGIITAGSFDDNLNFHSFRSFLGLDAKTQNHIVEVRDERGQAIANAEVTVKRVGDQKSATYRTGSKGNVVFVTVDNPSEKYEVIVAPENGKKYRKYFNGKSIAWKVSIPKFRAEKIKNLDLAIVFDTTGSMSDELNYLKSEFRNIVANVARQFPKVNQQYSLTVYRDHGDNYVTRSFDFTSNLDKFDRILDEQEADGGGDYPEAMDEAIAELDDLDWRDGQTAKVVFLIADAPPHAHRIDNTIAKINKLRERGITVYPVAGSGVMDEAEKVLRQASLVTNGQYIWLTDDSGVGNSHAEPHIPCYHVQKLNKLMVQMIANELNMRRQDPHPTEIVRTVGNPKNGRCSRASEQDVAHTVIDLP